MLVDPKAAHDLPSDIRCLLPSCRRIRQRAVFNLAFRKKGLVNKWFAVYALENKCGFARLGMAISKKNTPTATARNFTKRLIREMFRQRFPAKRALDVVVCARRPIKPENSAEGRQALIQLLKVIQA
ncbi:MAG: ribonuclease P protein component [Gallionellaceae bacterium]